MLFHAKAPAGGWVGGRKAWDRAQLLAVEWGAANVQLSYLKKKYKGEMVQHLYLPFSVSAQQTRPTCHSPCQVGFL